MKPYNRPIGKSIPNDSPDPSGTDHIGSLWECECLYCTGIDDDTFDKYLIAAPEGITPPK